MDQPLWKCPVAGCNEEIVCTIGPASLQLEISNHYRAFHADIEAMSERFKHQPMHTWRCPRANCTSPDVSRRDEATLNLAIIGHDRYYHFRELEAQVATPQYIQPSNDVYIPMHGGIGPYDRKFLSGVKIIW